MITAWVGVRTYRITDLQELASLNKPKCHGFKEKLNHDWVWRYLSKRVGNWRERESTWISSLRASESGAYRNLLVLMNQNLVAPRWNKTTPGCEGIKAGQLAT